MRKETQANLFFLGSGIAFFITLILKIVFPEQNWIQFCLFVSEAALVGSIADWFAVRALFEKPLGWPLHTAIIPRQRDSVIQGISAFIESELLNKDAIKNKIHNTHIIRLLIKWVDENKTETAVGDYVSKILIQWIKGINPQQVAKQLNGTMISMIEKLDISPYIAKLLDKLTEDNDVDQFIENILDLLSKKVKNPETKEAIYNFLVQMKNREVEKRGFFGRLFYKFAENFNGVNLSDATELIYEEIIEVLKQLKDRTHPVRMHIYILIEEIKDNLSVNRRWRRSLDHWKNDVLTRVNLEEPLEKLITELIRLITDAPTESQLRLLEKANIMLPISKEDHDRLMIQRWISKEINKYWELFKHNRSLQDKLDQYLKEVIVYFIHHNHHLIGQFIRSLLNTYDNKKLNDLIDSKIGEDLHQIRINGTVLGAIIGCIVFVVLSGYKTFF